MRGKAPLDDSKTARLQSYSRFASYTNVSPLGFSRVQVQCKVFFQNFQSICSKFASIINVFPLCFSRVRVQCKVFFLDLFQNEENRGKLHFLIIFENRAADLKLVLKVNQYIYKYWDGSAVWNKEQYFDGKSTNKW